MNTIIGETITLKTHSVRVEENMIDEDLIKYYQVKDTENKTFMLKIFAKPLFDEYKNELQGFKSVGLHGKILQYCDTFEDSEYFGLLLEYTSRFTISSLLSTSTFNDSQIITIIRDVSLALFHIHSKKLVHGNLSPKSIFVTNDYKFKLGDMALICQESEIRTKEIKIPQELRAPEQIEISLEMPMTRAIDIWALGCLVYQLLYSKSAFTVEDLDSQVRGKFRKSEIQVGECWKLVLSRLLDPNPMTRASIQEIITLIHESYMPKMILIENVDFLKSNSLFKKSSSSWVKTLTAENEGVPDQIFISKLVGKAWNKPFKIPKFFSSLLQRPYTKPLVAIKCLIVVFVYITLGPPSSCEFEMGGVLFFEEIGKYWNLPIKTKKDKTITDELLNLIISLIFCIKSKLTTHNSTKTHGDWTDLIIVDLESLSAVLNYWNNNIEATKALLLNPENFNTLRAHFAGLLIQEQQKIMMEVANVLSKNSKTEAVEMYFIDNKANTLTLIQRYKSCFPKTVLAKLYFTEPVLPKTLSDPRPSIKSVRPEEKAKTLSSKRPTILSENPSWNININELELKQSIGIGSSCTVYKGKYRHTSVAVKILKNNSSQGNIKEFEREVEAMIKLRHPNLVLFMGACVEKELCIVTEFCYGDTVFNLLHEKIQVSLSFSQQIKIAKDTAQGMAFLHSSNLLHRDLKSLNLLLAEPVNSANDKIHVKITDFGISRTVGIENDVMTGQMGTCHWMAPEVLASEAYGFPADVYSYGIVLWEIFARETPYKGINPAMIPYQVLNMGLRPDINKVSSEIMKELICKCWDKDPAVRPNFSEILEFLYTI